MCPPQEGCAALSPREKSADSERIFALALFAVSIMPFSTTLLAQFMAYRVALLTYWLNIVLAGGSLYFSWNCAKGLGLVKDDIAPEVPCTIQ